MKVLQMVSRLNIGGTEKYILSISRILLKHGARVGVAAEEGPLTSSFRKAGITLHILPRGKKREQISLLASIIGKEKYNLIHAHDSKSFAQAAILSRKQTIPFIATVHGTYHHRNALLAAALASKQMIAVSPKLSQWLINNKIPAEKISMIPNGIDFTIFRPAADAKLWKKSLRLQTRTQILIYAGRFSVDKYSIAKKVILAAERIAKNNRQFIAVFVGPGTRRSNLLQLATDINHRLGRTAIVVRPAMHNIQHAYHAADIVVGTGRVALEAMACGKPLVAIGVAGYCGIVREKNMNKMIHCHFGDHGAFAPTSVEKLAADINSILVNPETARKMGEFNVKTVRLRFSIQSVGSRLLKIYKEVPG